jgi:arylsulfatase A-like enzyme
MLTRRSLLAAALAQRPARRPNVIWFMYDDLGSAGLGCFGATKIRTPHSDRVAKEGMRLTACYAGGSVCAPSRSVLMSGLHLGHAPVRANAQTVPLRPDDFTVAELFQQAGYVTGGFGKWGLGDTGTTGSPIRQGFNEFFGYLHQTHAHNYWPEYLRDGDQKVPLPANAGRKKGTYSASLIADRMEQFIEKHHARPFFLYATPTLPHGIFHPPTDAPYANEPWSQEQRNYAAMVTDADTQLGRLLAQLDKHGIADNTIVFVTSDNGGPRLPFDADDKLFATNRGLRGHKGQLFEGGLRVPMIVRWPGRVKPGTENATPCYFADFLPTVAALTGKKPPTKPDGVSLLPALEGKPLPRRTLYWEQENWDGKTKQFRPGTLAQAARVDRWKAIRAKPGAPLALYDLLADPQETTDVAAREPKVAAEMEKILAGARVPPRPHDNGNDEWVGRKDLPEGDRH